MSVGKFIQKMARERDLALSEVAYLSGLGLSRIMDLIVNDPDEVDIETARELSRAFNLSGPEFFLELEVLDKRGKAAIKELHIFQRYESLTPEQKDQVLDIMNNAILSSGRA